jgi:hypothetical protein
MSKKQNSNIEVTGSLSIVVFDTELQIVKQEIFIPNLVVQAGKNFIASRMVGTSSNIMSHMGLGTSSTAESNGDTALGAELTVAGGYTGYARAVLSGSSANANVVTYSANFAANNPSAPSAGAILREAGIFNASTAGVMLCRTTFPTVTKLQADALTVTWTITIS